LKPAKKKPLPELFCNYSLGEAILFDRDEIHQEKAVDFSALFNDCSKLWMNAHMATF